MAAKDTLSPAATIFILHPVARWHPTITSTHDRFYYFHSCGLALAESVFAWPHASGLAFFVFVGVCCIAIAKSGRVQRSGADAPNGAICGAGMAGCSQR